MNCPICKAPMVEEMMDYVVDHEGETLRLEDVPTWVCEQCDHIEVEESVAETVEDMLAHLDTMQADVEQTPDAASESEG